MQQNTIYAADIAVMQAHIEALQYHAERLREATLRAAESNVAEPRLFAADELAGTVLAGIAYLPALAAAPEVSV